MDRSARDADRLLTLAPTGPLHFELTPRVSSATLLVKAQAGASSFALVRRGRAVVDAGDVLTPTPELRRVLEDVHPLRDHLLEANWVSEWPGTRSGGAALWVRCRGGGAPPFPLDDALLWRGFGAWSDLQLFRGPHLELFVCSHEGFGQLRGTRGDFDRLGLSRSAGAPMGLALTGKPVDTAVLQLFAGG